MSSRPDATGVTGAAIRGRMAALLHARPLHRLVGGAALIAWAASALLLTAHDTRADAARFLPWKESPTPPLELRDLAGRPHALADYRGRVVLVNFWATWCEFCRDETASMKKLQEQLAGRPLTIIAVNFGESEARVRDYAKSLPAELRVLLDPNQDVARAWRVRVIPTSFLVDADGHVRYHVIGNIDWASAEVVRTVRALFP